MADNKVTFELVAPEKLLFSGDVDMVGVPAPRCGAGLARKEASMAQTPLRFVHAGDLHLVRPLSGVAEVPAHLREAFLEAPYLAAQQIFETALTEGADAVLLAGDVVHLDRAGPRARPGCHVTFRWRRD